MEILGIGIDLVEIDRMERAMARHEELVSRVFSPRERELCDDHARPAQRYAACFAAKEAASKALGTGVMGFAWQEVEMLRDDRGRPYLALSGRAQELAYSRGVKKILISVSHSRGLAVAVAQAVGGEVGA